MPKALAVLGSVLFFVAAPGVLAGLVPWWMTHREVRSPFLRVELTRAIGVILILAGAAGLVGSFARFCAAGARHARADRADPTSRGDGALPLRAESDVSGSVGYHSRQALMLGDWRLVVYGAVFWLACHLFVVTYEEPTLQQTFGAEYEAFRANVPRWIPRLTPWRAE